MALSFFGVVAVSFIDWFRLTGRSAFEGTYFVTYVIPSTVVVMGGTLAGQLATALRTARELTATLDKRVAERTEALTLANQRLEELSTTDSLTGPPTAAISTTSWPRNGSARAACTTRWRCS